MAPGSLVQLARAQVTGYRLVHVGFPPSSPVSSQNCGFLLVCSQILLQLEDLTMFSSIFASCLGDSFYISCFVFFIKLGGADYCIGGPTTNR